MGLSDARTATIQQASYKWEKIFKNAQWYHWDARPTALRMFTLSPVQSVAKNACTYEKMIEKCTKP